MTEAVAVDVPIAAPKTSTPASTRLRFIELDIVGESSVPVIVRVIVSVAVSP